MTDDYCVFLILASMIALVLPSGGALLYTGFAVVLVGLAGAAGGIERVPSTDGAPSPRR